MNGNDQGTVRTGAHVSAPRQSGCAGCGHPLTLHSNGTTACKAAGCKGGPGGGPCEGFARLEDGGLPELLAS